MAAEEPRSDPAAGTTEEMLYRTKVIQFLGRATPIVLQNDNGPCPLLAICNVLLLRNNLKLSLDVSEVSLQKLLSLVAERLIDSNSNVQDKDDGYLNNQQQNISDAIDLLPRLATGIDVNVLFRKINDFEFTRECAIFDLLDIGLYHGWIVDPQDTDTAAAIGSRSYNTIVSELVQAFEMKKAEGDIKGEEEEDCVDFSAATAATLGVPSPLLSRGRSFEDQNPASIQQRRKGDIEEEEELMRALTLSKSDVAVPVSDSMLPIIHVNLDENESVQRSETETTDYLDIKTGDGSSIVYQSHILVSKELHINNDLKDDVLAENNSLLNNNLAVNSTSQADSNGPEHCEKSSKSDEDIQTETESNQVPNLQSSDDGDSHNLTAVSENDQFLKKSFHDDLTVPVYENPAGRSVTAENGKEELSNVSDGIASSLQENEPIYEGEECILSGSVACVNPEPVYEGEMILAVQTEKIEDTEHPANIKDNVVNEQWHLIKNFLEHNANQLTIYGLFCLQEGLKERELCVFFRNNHFSTMFKYNGELYLLATDQGYLNQPDLVWEKLNEVNGDTIFMTGNFMEFKADSQVHDSWNEQSAMTNTADYLAALQSAGHPSALNSDLQLAIALQQEEFGQQPQRPQQQQQQQQQQQPPPQPRQQHSQQPSIPGRSRLITGPQVLKTSNPLTELSWQIQFFLPDRPVQATASPILLAVTWKLQVIIEL
ncbi:uncharacterized protein LOC121982474 isoform X2 [Zingiber officinale]|uniref:uncharacterized protein LOC121982474 isoform X2 n=1 Tax=Zingiber officinale TaxID=94328 RepID=UPI001C4CAA13|nr:uncharacterized protein LOC121982474 isoform X2 [Zingiber officinale]